MKANSLRNYTEGFDIVGLCYKGCSVDFRIALDIKKKLECRAPSLGLIRGLVSEDKAWVQIIIYYSDWLTSKLK